MNKYQSYKPSGVEWIGEIPEHWETIRFGMLGIFSSSGIDKKLDDNETSVRMVNYTDIIKSRVHNPIINDQIDFMVVTTPQSKLEEHKLRKGDLVFLPSSETSEDLGVSSLIDFDENDIVYSYHILRFKFLKEVNHYFKKYIGNHNGVYNQFSLEGKGTTRQIIGRNVFRNVKVVLPPISEQQQIVQFLDEKTELIDKLISTKERKITLLKEQRTSLINQVVTKGLNPNVKMKDSGVEWIGEIPEGWMVSKFKYVSEIVTGNTPSKTDGGDYYSEEGFLWIKPTYLKGDKYVNDSDEKLTELGKKQTRVIPKDSIMICCIGNTIGKYGMSEQEVSTNQQINSVIPNKSKITPWYCLYFVDVFTKDLLNRSNFVTLPILTKSDLENIEIIIPTLEEQILIVEYIESKTKEIDDLVQLEQKKIDLLKEYRQSLISEVVTGKIKVTK